MTEFTKTKISFALALLGTLFALHPFLDRYPEAEFHYLTEYIGYSIKVSYAFALTAALLALSVYCYAVELINERPSAWMERLGNSSYAIAIMVPPLFGGLFLAGVLEQELEHSRLVWVARTGPAVALALGAGWLVLSQVLALRLRRGLGERDRHARVHQLAEHEMHALGRAREMYGSEHHDLAVVEAWKAVEARLRRVLLKKHIRVPHENVPELIAAVVQCRLVSEPTLALIHELRRQWSIAVGTEAVTRENASAALSAARTILATIATDEPHKHHRKAA
jgi:HEPN domain-containing protein